MAWFEEWIYKAYIYTDLGIAHLDFDSNLCDAIPESKHVNSPLCSPKKRISTTTKTLRHSPNKKNLLLTPNESFEIIYNLTKFYVLLHNKQVPKQSTIQA